jgi:hypothetical protein
VDCWVSLRSLSLHTHSWKGKNVSGTWVKIINLAKQKIVDLQNENDKSINPEDVNFLNAPTQTLPLFTTNHYSKQYAAKKVPPDIEFKATNRKK